MGSPIASVIIADNPNADISELITDLTVSLTLDQVSQVSITVLDQSLQMMSAGYFQQRQRVEYLGMKMEISSIEVSQDQAGPVIHLECRPIGPQALKHWRTREVINAGSASGYVAQKARDVGLALFAESTPSRQGVAQASTPTAEESVWKVMQRLASEVGFALFESDNRLFFASEPYLLGKFGLAGYGPEGGFLSIPVLWNAEPMSSGIMRRFAPAIPAPASLPPVAVGATGPAVLFLQTVLRLRAGQTITDPDGTFGLSTEAAVANLQAFFNITGNPGKVGSMTWETVMFLANGVDYGLPAFGSYYLSPLGIPNLRKSDDAYEQATGSFTLERAQGKLLRPGMTVHYDGIYGFEGHHLITDVSWREGVNDPVTVSTRTLVPPLPDSSNNNEELRIFQRQLSFTGGGLAQYNFTSPLSSTS